MKFGCCTNMIASCPDGTGMEFVGDLKNLGFDYVELPLAQLVDLSESRFAWLVEKVNASDILCECCNNFFPTSIRLTGPDVDHATVHEYIDRSLHRAALLGVKIIVFGSSGARNTPPGYPKPAAWKQLVKWLQLINEKVTPLGITIVIEPLNILESNIINTTCEGLQLVKEVNRENIKLLIDYYHSTLEGENPEILLNVGSVLKHIHLSGPPGRTFPFRTDGSDYHSFFHKVREIAYGDRLSIEAYSNDFLNDAVKSLSFLKQLFTQVQSCRGQG